MKLTQFEREFMDIMGGYLIRQQDDPTFDPSKEIYDLYDDLVSLYFSFVTASMS